MYIATLHIAKALYSVDHTALLAAAEAADLTSKTIRYLSSRLLSEPLRCQAADGNLHH